MNAVIKDIKDMTDSKEMLEAKAHPFVLIFIYMLLSILVIALVWSYFGEIDDYVKANGVVRPTEKISTITNQVTGKIKSINIEKGAEVKAGDILYIIDHSNLELEKTLIENEYKNATGELTAYKLLKKSIEEEKNYFEGNTDKDNIYYNRYLKFKADIDMQSKNARLDSELNSQRLKEARNEVNNLILLKSSVANNKNLFEDKDSSYYYQYVDYTINIKILNDSIQELSKKYDLVKNLKESGAASENEVEDLKKAIENKEVELEKYKNDFFLNLNSEIEKNSTIIKELEINEELNNKNFENDGEKDELAIKKYKMDTLVQLDSEIVNLQKSIERLEKDIESLKLSIENCTVTTPIDGIVNMNSEINKGDLLQSGVDLATIVPKEESKYKVQLYVSNQDIARVEHGQKIKLHFLALPYREYGQVEGEVTKISIDSNMEQQTGNSFYMVEAEFENTPLYSYKGVKGEIKVGMVCEAQVITGSKKILYYLLEKINLRD